MIGVDCRQTECNPETGLTVLCHCMIESYIQAIDITWCCLTHAGIQCASFIPAGWLKVFGLCSQNDSLSVKLLWHILQYARRVMSHE